MTDGQSITGFLFSAKDIEKWSAFSGDYNALHYPQSDSDQPRPVQGMLTLLHIKPVLTYFTTTWKQTGSLTIDTIFRNHVFTSVRHQLLMKTDETDQNAIPEIPSPSGKQDRQSLQFSLNDANQKRCVVGKVSIQPQISLDNEHITTGKPAAKNTDSTLDWKVQEDDLQLSLPSPHMTEKLHQFMAVMNQAYSDKPACNHAIQHKPYSTNRLLWFLDAITFQMVAHCDYFLQFDHYCFTSLNDYLDASITVQTGQQSIYSRTALALSEDLANVCKEPASTTLKPITVDIHRPAYIESQPGQYIRIFQYRCRYGDQVIHLSKTTLLSKMTSATEISTTPSIQSIKINGENECVLQNL